MSRGLGAVQRRVLEVLEGRGAGQGLPVAGLGSRVGGDRSNVRRAVVALAVRGLVEESTVGGERCVRLTLRGALAASPLERDDPYAEIRAARERFEKELREIAAERERAREEARREAPDGPSRHGHVPRIVRRRYPGPTQRAILALLWGFADPLDSGLPTLAVKAVVRDSLDTDRSNVRRAIRSLLLRGEIEESEDGGFVRLAEGTAVACWILPPVPPQPLDEDRIRAVLGAYRSAHVVA